MSILSFVSLKDIEDLDDDPQIAFVELVNHAQQKYDLFASRLKTKDFTAHDSFDELNITFINAIIAAAKKFEIEPLSSAMTMSPTTYAERHYREFKAELDHYITKLVLDSSIRSRKDAVVISARVKDDIRSYVSAMRRCIEESSMSDAKRDALLKKLNEFEEELERRRLSLVAVTRLVFALWAVPGATWASVEVANKLITNIMQTVAEAKATEQEMKQLAPTAPPKALSPPQSVAPDKPTAA